VTCNARQNGPFYQTHKTLPGHLDSVDLVSTPRFTARDILSSDVLQMDIIIYCVLALTAIDIHLHSTEYSSQSPPDAHLAANLNVSYITERFAVFSAAIHSSDTTNIACHVSTPVHQQQFSNAVGEVDVTKISRQQHMTVLRLNVCWT